MKQAGFFDVEERLARLSGPGDQLEAFSRTVDFEGGRPALDKALAYSDGSKGGPPPFGLVTVLCWYVISFTWLLPNAVLANFFSRVFRF